jgi:hypothetical protein
MSIPQSTIGESSLQLGGITSGFDHILSSLATGFCGEGKLLYFPASALLPFLSEQRRSPALN